MDALLLTAQGAESAVGAADLSRMAGWWESSPCPQLVLDAAASTVVQVNDTFARWSGLGPGAVVGTDFARLLPVGDRILWSTHCLPKLETAGRVSEISVQVIGADGVRRAAFLTASRVGSPPDDAQTHGPARGPDAAPPDGVVLVALFGAAERRRYEEDLLEAKRGAEASEARRARAEQGLQHLVHHDPVTGLLNRRGLEAALYDTLACAAAVDSAPSGPGAVLGEGVPAPAPRPDTVVVFIDLNGFKQVNDSVGHAGGDALLVAVADRLRATVRQGAAVARFAGDEFVIVDTLPGHADAEVLCRRLMESLAPPAHIQGVEVVISASVGVARCAARPGAGQADVDAQAEALLQQADAAMYLVKRSGRSGWRVHHPSDVDDTADRLRLLEQLRHAITSDQLRLHYQPRVELEGGHVSGVEALVRWQHPQRGLLAPGHFIELAEQSGLIRELGAWVLETAIAQAAAWNAEGRTVQLSVNVSARQLVDPQLTALVTSSLARHGVPAHQLVLEITETALMSDPEIAATTLGELSRLGVRIAIDDFGTGYASLTYLRRFPVHELKVDQSFVAGIAEDAGDRAIVAGCIQLAQALGLASVAEGVETTAQRDVLRELGCQLVQGYFFGRPQDAEALPWS